MVMILWWWYYGDDIMVMILWWWYYGDDIMVMKCDHERAISSTTTTRLFPPEVEVFDVGIVFQQLLIFSELSSVESV